MSEVNVKYHSPDALFAVLEQPLAESGEEGLNIKDLAPYLDALEELLRMLKDGILTDDERERVLIASKDLFDGLFDRLEQMAQGNEKLVGQLLLLIGMIRMFGGGL